MTEFLIRKFVKEYENTQKKSVRRSYVLLSTVTGVAANVLLFLIKLICGYLSGSASVVSDAFNNLSDCMSFLIALFGYHVSAKPADREHPFGHGRMEYLVSLGMSMVILFTGFQLFISSARSIVHPSQVHVPWWMFFLLMVSVFVKLWLSKLNEKVGKRIENTSLLAVSEDSRNDVLITIGTLLALCAEMFLHLHFVDALASMIIAVFIVRSGVELLKEIIDRLIGTPIDRTLAEAVADDLNKEEEVLGVHDLLIHDYGSAVRMGSAHLEVDSRMSLIGAHEIADRLEKRILDRFGIRLTLHIDPVNVEDTEGMRLKENIEHSLNELYEGLSLHDFRRDSKKISFDILIPYECKIGNETIIKAIRSVTGEDAALEIEFDHDYVKGGKA